MTRYNLPDERSKEWYSSPLYPAVADLDRRVGKGSTDISALQTAVAAAQAAADAANAVKPYWYGYLGADVSLADNTNVLITTWTQDSTFGGFAYSAGVLTFPALAGRYSVLATLFYDPSSNVGGRLTQVFSGAVSGNPLISGGTAGSTGANNKGQSAIASKEIPFAASAQIRVLGYQSAGGTLNAQGSANKNLSFWQVRYIGPV